MMSRRYGRNQKRQAREEITKLETQLSDACDQIQHLSWKQNQYDDWAERILQLVGRNSAFNSILDQQAVSKDEFDRYIDTRSYHFRRQESLPQKGPIQSVPFQSSVNIIRAAVAYVETNVDDARNRIAFELTCGQDRSAIVVDCSETLLIMTNHIAGQLVGHLQKRGVECNV